MSQHQVGPTLTPDRPRPRLHFTANDGWINDPYGVAFTDGRYHLYYQAIPGRVTWAPNCHWGHAQSEDLVHWEEQPLALIPQDFEVGCWSGSVVHADGRQLIFYTRVSGENWEIGKVATAAIDTVDGVWSTTAEDVVIEGPPEDLGVTCFRDPFVFAHDGEWVMLMAAALPNETAAVLQYHSTDLSTWTFDGVLCSRSSDVTDEVWTGSLWECPQLFQVGDSWALVVSVWHGSVLHYVAASVGDYDGRRFTPSSWQRLTYGSSAYAMSAFTDNEGRRCVLSWLREEPQNNEALRDRAGAHSVVATVELGPDGSLVLRPHPHVDTRLQPPLDAPAAAAGSGHLIGAAPVDVTITAAEGLTVRVGEAGHPRADLTVRGDSLVLDRPELDQASQPLDPSAEVRILLDADVVEVFTDRSYGAFRITPALDAEATLLTVDGPTASTALVRRFRV